LREAASVVAPAAGSTTWSISSIASNRLDVRLGNDLSAQVSGSDRGIDR
jgi:hypothetical protein